MLQVASPMAPKRGAVVRWFDWTVGSSTKGCCILVERVSPFSLRFNLLFLGRLASMRNLDQLLAELVQKSRSGQIVAVGSQLNKVSGTLWRRVERCFVLGTFLAQAFSLASFPFGFALLILPPSSPPPALSH